MVTSSRLSGREEDGFTNVGSKFTPLSAVADAFEELAAVVEDANFSDDLDLKTFTDACSYVSVLFGCLGTAFKFAELEYCAKVCFSLFQPLCHYVCDAISLFCVFQVNVLKGATDTHKTLKGALDFDVENGSVRTAGSLSRSIRRVRQGIDLIATLFQNFLAT